MHEAKITGQNQISTSETKTGEPATGDKVAENIFTPHRKKGNIGRTVLPYLLILPTVFFIAAFTFYPAIYAMIQSTIKPPRTVSQEPRFVGFQNYLDLFDEATVIGQSDNFPRVFNNTLVFVLITVPISIVLAFLLALLLNRQLKLSGWYRSAIFYPVLLPMISAASIWAFMFADQFGLINTLLRALGLNPLGWTRDPNWALPAIMLVVIWKQAGYYMIFYLSGMQNLAHDIFEAAQLDGANAWQRLKSFTIPLLNGTTLFIVVIAGAAAFQTADPLYVLGQGQPNNRSNLVLYYIYQLYTEPRNTGYVYAMTIALLGLILVFTIANFFFLERRANYD
jgi:sn-glycerol 3-phosphate transport system permease protein